MNRLRLTEAQVSALECAGLEPGAPGLDDGEQLLQRAWQGDRLVFDEADRDALFTAVQDRSNAEDGQAEEQGDAFARRASKTLGNLASKILFKKT